MSSVREGLLVQSTSVHRPDARVATSARSMLDIQAERGTGWLWAMMSVVLILL